MAILIFLLKILLDKKFIYFPISKTYLSGQNEGLSSCRSWFEDQMSQRRKNWGCPSELAEQIFADSTISNWTGLERL